jgi:hypothetical protein
VTVEANSVQGSYKSVVSWRTESRRICSFEVPEGLKARRFEVIIFVLRSVARRQLKETHNPLACAKVDWKVGKSAITLYK